MHSSMLSVPVLLSIAVAVFRPVAAQTTCGGNEFTPGTVNLTLECYDAIQNCVANLKQCYSGQLQRWSRQCISTATGEPAGEWLEPEQ